MIIRFKPVLSAAAGLAFAASLASSVFADQHDPRLPDYFEQLKSAASPSMANSIEQLIWQSWLEHPDKDAEVRLNFALTQMQSGQPYAALNRMDALVKDHPEWAEAWNKRATYRYMIGAFEGSLLDLKRALELEPNHFGALAGAGSIKLSQGDLPAALEFFKRAAAVNPLMDQVQETIEALEAQIRSKAI